MRYLVYAWDEDIIKDIDNDYYEGALFEMLENNQFGTPSEYGTKVGEYNTEEEANEAATKYYDDNRNVEISIYDKEEKIWFN